MSDKNKQERVFKSMQVLTSECLNQWTRLRLPTNEGIWFWPTAFITNQIVAGWIWGPDYERSNCPGCTNRWITLFLPTGKSIQFFPLRYAGNHIFGRIDTTGLRAMCEPFAPIPTDLTGVWEVTIVERGISATATIALIQNGFNYLIQSQPYEYFVPGEGTIEGIFPYATLWGYELYGQWREDGQVGRFRWTISPDARSFVGTFGFGDNFEGGGTETGIKVEDIVL